MRRPGARFTCCNDTQPASTHRFMSFLWQAARGWPGVEDARTGLHHSPWANPKSGTAGRVLGSADARRCGPPTTHPSAHTARATAGPPSVGGAPARDHAHGQIARDRAPTAAAESLASKTMNPHIGVTPPRTATPEVWVSAWRASGTESQELRPRIRRLA